MSCSPGECKGVTTSTPCSKLVANVENRLTNKILYVVAREGTSAAESQPQVLYPTRSTLPALDFKNNMAATGSYAIVRDAATLATSPVPQATVAYATITSDCKSLNCHQAGIMPGTILSTSRKNPSAPVGTVQSACIDWSILPAPAPNAFRERVLQGDELMTNPEQVVAGLAGSRFWLWDPTSRKFYTSLANGQFVANSDQQVEFELVPLSPPSTRFNLRRAGAVLANGNFQFTSFQRVPGNEDEEMMVGFVSGVAAVTLPMTAAAANAGVAGALLGLIVTCRVSTTCTGFPTPQVCSLVKATVENKTPSTILYVTARPGDTGAEILPQVVYPGEIGPELKIDGKYWVEFAFLRDGSKLGQVDRQNAQFDSRLKWPNGDCQRVESCGPVNNTSIPGTRLVSSVKVATSTHGACWEMRVEPAPLPFARAQGLPFNPQVGQEFREINSRVGQVLGPALVRDPAGLVSSLVGTTFTLSDNDGKFYYNTGADGKFTANSTVPVEFTVVSAGATRPTSFNLRKRGETQDIPNGFFQFAAPFGPIEQDPDDESYDQEFVVEATFVSGAMPATIPMLSTQANYGVNKARFRIQRVSPALARFILEADPYLKMRCCSIGVRGFYRDLERQLCSQTAYQVTGQPTRECDAFMGSEWCAAPLPADRELECACFPAAPIEDPIVKEIIEGLGNSPFTSQARKCLVPACRDGEAFLDARQRNATCAPVCLQIRQAIAKGDFSQITLEGRQFLDCAGEDLAPLLSNKAQAARTVAMIEKEEDRRHDVSLALLIVSIPVFFVAVWMFSQKPSALRITGGVVFVIAAVLLFLGVGIAIKSNRR